MVRLAFTMAEPYPGESRIVNMIKSCCVHNGGRTWCDFSGPLVGGVPCGEGSESKVGGTTGFCCSIFWAFVMFFIFHIFEHRFIFMCSPDLSRHGVAWRWDVGHAFHCAAHNILRVCVVLYFLVRSNRSCKKNARISHSDHVGFFVKIDNQQ